ncbi:MAG: tyrosine-type recombinase/integrase [candidate division WOR-3 bacterium]
MRLLIQLSHWDDNMALRMRYPEKAFRKACREAGIRDFRFHDLRHTYASWKVMDGVDLRSVAELLGHRTLAMVMRYSHLSPDHLDKIREKGVMVRLQPKEFKL